MAQTSGHTEIYAGAALLAAAVLALLVVNLGGAGWYEGVLGLKFGPVFEMAGHGWDFHKSLHHWINDGLMALFFLVVGIEIKRELRFGALRDRAHAMLPVFGAVGGIVAPMLVYLAVQQVMNAGPETKPGWAIPAATDIAFAVALATVLKPYIAAPMRAFLLALAVLDDLAAIVIIALFYSTGLDALNLALGGIGLLGLVALNRLRVRSVWPYVVVGFFMWLAVLQSGVHATVAGVLLGVLLPQAAPGKPSASATVEHALHPFVLWLILPLFAFANVGLNLTGLGWEHVLEPVVIGVALGLWLGKQAGILLFVWLAEALKLAHRPAGVGWRQVHGVACLCGIGFTMSLFIGNLAFAHNTLLLDEVRLGVLAGSILSAITAVLVLRRAGK